MVKYQVIYREHNKLQLDTLHIGPFDTFDEAYTILCTLPALGTFDEDANDFDGPPLSGVKYVEPIFQTFEEALKGRDGPFTEEELDSLQIQN